MIDKNDDNQRDYTPYNPDETPKSQPETPPADSKNNNNDYSSYGGNVQYKWNYDDYQKALAKEKNEKSTKSPKPPKKHRIKNKGTRVFVMSVCSLFAVAIVGLSGFGIYSLVKKGTFPFTAKLGSSNSGATMNLQNIPSSSSSTASSTAATPLQMSASQVYSSVSKSVVGIVVYNMQSVNASAEGSGVVMDNNYIITNAHVISDAQKVQVVTADKKTYNDVTVVGSDSRSDLAVLKINTTDKLTAATFGNSSQVKTGDSVLAIGNPGGLEFQGSVTSGIISAVDRLVSNNGVSMKCIQTDAAINPGNSGGALVNMYGQVIGITSSKIEETGYEGMGFAIPISTAKPIVDSIVKNGYVTGRVKIGITVQPFTSERAQLFNLSQGLQVVSVDKTSDAYSKGVKANDIITKINGKTVASGDSSTWYDNFQTEESKCKAGQSITLTICRATSGSSKTFDVSVTLVEDKGESSSSESTSSSGTNQRQYGNQQGGSSSGSSFYNWFYGSDGSN